MSAVRIPNDWVRITRESNGQTVTVSGALEPSKARRRLRTLRRLSPNVLYYLTPVSKELVP